VARVGSDGLEGDRGFAIYDVATGYGLTARRVPQLLFASARWLDDDRVEITLPDGSLAVSERVGAGEYDRMISQHLDKALTPEQRARWVLLLARSADEVGLPADAEFRAAFTAYLEWGSRIALENSQPGVHPPPHVPVPRWWWVGDAEPWSRPHATKDAVAEEPPPPLPDTDQPISFAATFDRCSVNAIATRCASPSTSGPTTKSARMPTRSSSEYEPEPCPATAYGHRNASASSHAGSPPPSPPSQRPHQQHDPREAKVRQPAHGPRPRRGAPAAVSAAVSRSRCSSPAACRSSSGRVARRR
jgi:hypothetical protein